MGLEKLIKSEAAQMRGEARQVSSLSKRTGANGAKLRAQGQRTRKQIIRAATNLLVKTGALDFSLRAVAREAKISVSNLQYYFPDRQELLRAVMAPVIEEYFSDFERALSSNSHAQEILDALIERTLRDANDPRIMSLVWHFSSLASIDPECARLRSEWYATLVDGVARLVRAVNPEIAAERSTELAMLLISMGDGLGFQFQLGYGADQKEALSEAFRRTVNFLLEQNPLLDGGSAKAGAISGDGTA